MTLARTPGEVVRELQDGVRVAADLRSASVYGTTVTGTDRGDLLGQLALALYEALHLRRPPRHPSAPNPRDRDFERSLIRVLPHRDVVGGAEIVRRERNRVLLLRGGVRVWTPADRLTAEHRDRSEGAVDVVLPAFDGAVSPGYLMVRGTRGGRSDGALARLYANVADPGHAPALLRETVRVLEEERVPHRVKVCTDRGQYPRTDTLVAYLAQEDVHAVEVLRAALNGHPGLASDTSGLVLRLSDGVGFAWEPRDGRPASRGLSFGLQRCTAVAEALADSAAPDVDLGQALERRLREASIDPRHPWRDTDSPDTLFAALTGK